MLRFSVVFVVLLLSFFAFELTPPGQAIVQPWTGWLASASASVMGFFGSNVVAHGTALGSPTTGFAVNIVAGCNGVEAVLVLFAGILAYPAPWRWKLAGMTAGLVAIQVLNLVRIVSLYYLGSWNRDAFEWAHLYVWQALIMLDAMIVWLLWTRAVPAPAAAPIAAQAA